MGGAERDGEGGKSEGVRDGEEEEEESESADDLEFHDARSELPGMS